MLFRGMIPPLAKAVIRSSSFVRAVIFNGATTEDCHKTTKQSRYSFFLRRRRVLPAAAAAAGLNIVAKRHAVVKKLKLDEGRT